MDIPAFYIKWRSSLGFDEISFGVGGIQLATESELEEFQVGYARSPDGESLCGANDGDWRKEWIAIGHETSMGDPIILDTKTMQVMTAAHGEGEWNPEPIAGSLDGFGVALSELRTLAVGRENPVQLEANPLPAKDLRVALARIAKANAGVDMLFWKLQLEVTNGA